MDYCKFLEQENIRLFEFAAAEDYSAGVVPEQLRSLWTAYCIHAELNVDTFGYDATLARLWNTVKNARNATKHWATFEQFDHYMANLLV